MGGTAEHHPNALALKCVSLENQDIVKKFLMCIYRLTDVLQSFETEFQPHRKVLRGFNFISIILEVVPSKELTFSNVAVRFAT